MSCYTHTHTHTRARAHTHTMHMHTLSPTTTTECQKLAEEVEDRLATRQNEVNQPGVACLNQIAAGSSGDICLEDEPTLPVGGLSRPDLLPLAVPLPYVQMS